MNLQIVGQFIYDCYDTGVWDGMCAYAIAISLEDDLAVFNCTQMADLDQERGETEATLKAWGQECLDMGVSLMMVTRI